jgi:anti-sigma regulatory factor (Ser/Thr protein kinase)
VIAIDARLDTNHELACFELSFRPSIELVSLVRRFVEAFYAQILADADLASRVALATHELLENAVKYACDGETRIRMEIRTPAAHPQIQIVTRNRALTEHARAVAVRLDEMNTLGDPFGYYQALMKRTSKLRGGLGLARIAAEAEMQITCAVDGDHVEVRATATREAH